MRGHILTPPLHLRCRCFAGIATDFISAVVAAAVVVLLIVARFAAATPGAVMPPCAASNPSLPASARRFPHNHLPRRLPSRCRPHRPPPPLCSGVSSRPPSLLHSHHRRPPESPDPHIVSPSPHPARRSVVCSVGLKGHAYTVRALQMAIDCKTSAPPGSHRLTAGVWGGFCCVRTNHSAPRVPAAYVRQGPGGLCCVRMIRIASRVLTSVIAVSL